MKAALLTANKVIEYADIPTPETKSNSVKIRVKASGICGSDVPRVLLGGAHYYPIVLGHEFSGVVEEVGDGVTKTKPGDMVSAAPLIPCMACEDCQRGNYALCKHYDFIGSHSNGSFAEVVVVPESNVLVFPQPVAFEKAAFFEPSTVALHGVFQNEFQGGGETAILGGGTIGLLTMLWCKLLGADKVTVFDISEKRLQLAQKLGADRVVNTGDDGYMKTAKEYTHGRGFDYVFETAGSAPTAYMAFEAAANKAKVCFIGNPHLPLTFPAPLWELMNRKEFRLTGSWMSYSAPFPGREWRMTAEYLADGRLKIDDEMIFRTYPLEKAQEAFMLYETPGAVEGKIMLEM